MQAASHTTLRSLLINNHARTKTQPTDAIYGKLGKGRPSNSPPLVEEGAEPFTRTSWAKQEMKTSSSSGFGVVGLVESQIKSCCQLSIGFYRYWSMSLHVCTSLTQRTQWHVDLYSLPIQPTAKVFSYVGPLRWLSTSLGGVCLWARRQERSDEATKIWQWPVFFRFKGKK